MNHYKQYVTDLTAFRQHSKATNDDIWDVLNSWELYDGKFDITITLNGRSICLSPSSIIYNGLDEMLRNEIAQIELDSKEFTDNR